MPCGRFRETAKVILPDRSFVSVIGRDASAMKIPVPARPNARSTRTLLSRRKRGRLSSTVGRRSWINRRSIGGTCQQWRISRCKPLGQGRRVTSRSGSKSASIDGNGFAASTEDDVARGEPPRTIRRASSRPIGSNR